MIKMFDPQYLIKKEVEETENQESDALSQVVSDSRLDYIFDKIPVSGLSNKENDSERQNWSDEYFSSVVIHVKRESFLDQETLQPKTYKLIRKLIDVKRQNVSDSSQTPQPEMPELFLTAEKQPEKRKVSNYSLRTDAPRLRTKTNKKKTHDSQNKPKTPELIIKLIHVKKQNVSDSSQTPQPETPELFLKAEKQPEKRKVSNYSLRTDPPRLRRIKTNKEKIHDSQNKQNIVDSPCKRFKCDQCSYTVKSNAKLGYHKLIHSSDKPIKCDQCSYATHSKVNLKSHKLVHSSNKPLKCDQCSFATRFKSSLYDHQLLHSSNRPFKCDQCSFATHIKKSLKTHKLVHSSNKPFKCDQCSYATHLKVNLKSHKLVHSSDKPLKCDQCSFACRYKASLKRHEFVHSSVKLDNLYKCDQCSNTTLFKSNLFKHKLTHSSEKPLKCDKCSYATHSKPNLKVHQLVHSSNKPSKRYHYNKDSNKNKLSHSPDKPFTGDQTYSYATRSKRNHLPKKDNPN